MTQRTVRDTAAEIGSVELDERRRASWLHSAYSDTRWTVSNTGDVSRTSVIDFSYRLADGRDLSEAVRLHATVKEYAWWVRNPRFSRIDDAKTHTSMVRNLLHIAHALSIRNIWSFAHLQAFDLEQLTEEIRFGADAVLRASERVEHYLNLLADQNKIDPKPHGGLPRYKKPITGAETNIIVADPVLRACNLPLSARYLPRVAALIHVAAKKNGLISKTKRDRVPPPLHNVTVQAMQRWLVPLEQLYFMRRSVEAEAITFRPFPLGSARVAAVKGVGTMRTPIPPPKLVLFLLENAARWIDDKNAKASVNRGEVLLDTTACWILIAAFSARRDEEIDDLRVGCLRGNDEDGWWLNAYIEKTLQRKEWIPVPGLVARAIERLMDISSSARLQSGSDRLFQWRGPKGKVTRLNPGRYLDNFAAAVNVPKSQPQGNPAVNWHWHPHQFRRFFAVLYFYRYEGATDLPRDFSSTVD